jgi:hypothetical protein
LAIALSPVWSGLKVGSERCESRCPIAVDHTLKDAMRAETAYHPRGLRDTRVVLPVAVTVALALLVVVGACSGGQPSTFTVSGASVDPTYWCPGGASNAPYDLNAKVDVRNGTNGTVTIESVTAQMKLAAVRGTWIQKVGDVYDAGTVAFSPSTVGAGSSASIKVVIPSSCTSDRYDSGGTSSGDYAVTMRLRTSAGLFGVTASDLHEIRAA